MFTSANKSRESKPSKHIGTDVNRSRAIKNLDVNAFMMGAPANSIRQTIKVDKLDDDVIEESRYRRERGGRSGDHVSEHVDMDIKDGKAIVTVKIRSEDVSPVDSGGLLKRSTVILTKRLQVDLVATPYRRQFYDAISGGGGANAGKMASLGNTLSSAEVFELYKKFMAMAELDKRSSCTNIRVKSS